MRYILLFTLNCASFLNHHDLNIMIETLYNMVNMVNMVKGYLPAPGFCLSRYGVRRSNYSDNLSPYM